MKYISQEALEQVLLAYIEARQSKIPHYKNREDRIRCEAEIRAFEVVLETLDCVVGIEIEKEVV